MPRFFITEAKNSNCNINGNHIEISGADASHISKVLRMKNGEELTVCDCKGCDYHCSIEDSTSDYVTLKIIEKTSCISEPTCKVTLYQGLPKSDKMDFIIQKAVELGVNKIVPVITKRTVSRPDKKSLIKKTERWNKIAEEACKQSGRGILVKVESTLTFNQAIEDIKQNDLSMILYEKNGGTLKEQLNKKESILNSVGIMVGPEGGFCVEEVELAENNNVYSTGMGPRILRTETAGICAISAIMFKTDNL